MSFLSFHDFPLFVPFNKELTEFEGFLPILDKTYRLHITLNEAGSLSKARIKGSRRLTNWFALLEDEMPELLRTATSMDSFLHELTKKIEDQMKRNNEAEIATGAVRRSVNLPLVKEVSVLGPNRAEVDWEINRVTLTLLDARGREHILELDAPKDYPISSLKVAKYSLPIVWELPGEKLRSLQIVYEEFTEVVDSLQSFWNDFLDLVDEVWFVDPDEIGWDVNVIQIVIAKGAGLKFEVNPMRPRSVPQVEFWGSPERAKLHLETFTQNVENWDEGVSLSDNLRSALQLNLPSQESDPKEFDIECGVCMSLAVDEIYCTLCSKPYHKPCLERWLSSKDGKRIGRSLFGICLYCNETIVYSP